MKQDRNNKSRTRLLRLIYSGLCLALAVIMPFFTGQIPNIGAMLCPMHIPVLLCGYLCGWQWGAVVGFLAPLLRFAITGMPPIFPSGLGMAFELASYAVIAGALYKVLPKKLPYIYVSLVAAMLGGRAVWGIVRYVFAGLAGSEFPVSAFIAGAVTNAVSGIVLQIIVVPLLVAALKRAKLILNE